MTKIKNQTTNNQRIMLTCNCYLIFVFLEFSKRFVLIFKTDKCLKSVLTYTFQALQYKP